MILNNNIQKIEHIFKVPDRVAGKIKSIVEKVKGGYVLIETRARWDGSPGQWTRLPVAKIIFHKPSRIWKLYWQRASGRWLLYSQHKTLKEALKEIKNDKDACFWG